jgi:hypothetical protein
MPTISTQSIGVIGVPLVTTPQVVNAARSAENGVKAALSKDQNKARAAKSATSVQANESRSVQDEARIEGVFGEGSEPEDGDGQREGQPKSPGSFHRTA